MPICTDPSTLLACEHALITLDLHNLKTATVRFTYAQEDVQLAVGQLEQCVQSESVTSENMFTVV